MNSCPSILEGNTLILHATNKKSTKWKDCFSETQPPLSNISHTQKHSNTHTPEWCDSSEYKTHTYRPYISIVLFTIDLHTTLWTRHQILTTSATPQLCACACTSTYGVPFVVFCMFYSCQHKMPHMLMASATCTGGSPRPH